MGFLCKFGIGAPVNLFSRESEKVSWDPLGDLMYSITQGSFWELLLFFKFWTKFKQCPQTSQSQFHALNPECYGRLSSISYCHDVSHLRSVIFFFCFLLQTECDGNADVCTANGTTAVSDKKKDWHYTSLCGHRSWFMQQTVDTLSLTHADLICYASLIQSPLEFAFIE